jgi:hypothetical protein
MGKTEAFCTQCGSLINVDDSKEKNKCIFCGSEVVTNKALELKNDTQTRVSLQQEAEKKAKEEALLRKQNQKQNKGAKLDVSNVPAKSTKEVIVMKPLPLKTKLILFGSLLGIVVILAGIFVPTILNRNQKRTVINNYLSQNIDFNIKSYAFKFNDNRELSIATDVSLSRTDAEAAYQSFNLIYKDTYKTTEAKTDKKLVLRLYAKNGLYTSRKIDGVLTVDFMTATPTPTITPTVAITNP